MGSVLNLAHSQLGDFSDVPQGFCSEQAPNNLFLLKASFLGGKLWQIFSKSTCKHISFDDLDAKETLDFGQDKVK